MKTFCKTLVLSILSLIGLAGVAPRAKADVVDISPYSHAAVAFSSSTGKYGYAWNHGSRAEAERVALSRCTEKDARIVGWVNEGFLVVAIGEDNTYGMGYRFGDGASNRDAYNRALKELSERTTAKGRPKVVIVLCSGNLDPQILK
jgi:hypothetical protein